MKEARIELEKCRDDRARRPTVFLPAEWLSQFDEISEDIDRPIVCDMELYSHWGVAFTDDGDYRRNIGHYNRAGSEQELEEIENIKREIEYAKAYLKQRHTIPEKRLFISLE